MILFKNSKRLKQGKWYLHFLIEKREYGWNICELGIVKRDMGELAYDRDYYDSTIFKQRFKKVFNWDKNHNKGIALGFRFWFPISIGNGR